MTVRQHILPPATTPLERAWDETLPAWGELADAFKTPSEGEPAAFVPWYAAEYGLAEFAPYFDTVPDLIEAGRQWLLVRGTAAAVLQAMAWVGFDGATVEEDGAYLHIRLPRIATPAQMLQIAHVVRASLPAHMAFFRVYHGHDMRPIVLDRGPAMDTGMLDGYSGTVGATGVVESFGQRTGGTLATHPTGLPISAPTEVRVSIARYDDMPVLDVWRLDSRVLAATSGGVMELTMYGTAVPPVGGGVRVRSQSQARTCAWDAPAPLGFATHTTHSHTTEPVHPPHHWGGPWGGPWRDQFQLISTEET